MNQQSGSGTTLRPARVVTWALAAVVLAVLAAACGSEQPGTSASGGGTTAGRATVEGADKLRACPSAPSKTPVANGLPDVSLPCLGSGPDLRLADLRGPLVLNVWAQWCGPCREEAPYLADLAKRAAGKVQLLGIDYDDPRPELAVKFATDHGLDYPHVVDLEKAIQGPLKVGGPPLTAFVDKDGAIVFVHRGVFTSQQQLDDLVREKLGVAL